MTEPTQPAGGPGPARPASGKYRLEARLGAGGMGEVWKAFDPELNRWVALKFLKGGDDEEVSRFQREAQIAAKLTHPNIAAVYEVGEAAGRHFLAMQLVDGRTLKTVPRNDVRELVRILRDAARAIEYAHRQGIVHRDLKPDNIMVSADGHVYVMDFGLARLVKAGSSMTASGMMLGTPAYMSPEQARGEVRSLDARTDVYSLGATLYELLTDRPPFQGETALDVAMKVVDEDPAPARRVNPSLDADLETIVAVCMEKDRGRRYATAAAVADELDRWLQGDAIRARPPSFTYRLRKKLAKRKGVMIMGGLGVTAVAIAIAVLLTLSGTERRRSELWAKLTELLTIADTSSRGGDRPGAKARLDEGLALCRAALASDETARGRFFLGRLLHARGDEADAIVELSRAIELDPAMGDARFLRGLVRVESYARRLWAIQANRDMTVEQAEARSPELRRLRDDAEADLAAPVGAVSFLREADGHYGRGELARLRGESETALRELRLAVVKDPNHARARLALARLLYARREYDEAVRNLNEACTRDRGYAEGWALRGLWQYRNGENAGGEAARGHYLAALADVDCAISMGHREAVAFNTRGSIRMALGRVDEAIEDFTEAVKLQPDFARAWSNRAAAHITKGTVDNAISDATEAIQLDPSATGGWLNRAGARSVKGDRHGAIEDCDHILSKLDANEAMAWCNRGINYSDLGDLGRAESDLEKALSLAPKLPQALAALSDVKQRRGDLKRAVELIDELLKVDPNDSDAWRRRSAILITHAEQLKTPSEIQRFLKGAASDATKAITFNPKNALAYYNRAIALMRLDDFDRALKDIETALELDPRMSDARASRASVYVALRNRAGRETPEGRRHEEAALADLVETVRRDPQYVIGWVNLANLRLDRNEQEAALACAQEALNVREMPEALGMKAVALLNLSRKQEAAVACRRALAIAPKDWPGRVTVERLLQEAEK